MLPPLPERMRPKSFDEFVGQQHLIGKGNVLRKIIEAGNIPSMIFWGPPGTGKTSLAQFIAQKSSLPFYQLSAIDSGVKEVRAVIANAEQKGKSILFIDEIHRFNKAQQDALLGAVERGTITLIGATTENPSFEVIGALLSRCAVYVLKHLELNDLEKLMHRAISEDEILKTKNIELKESAALMKYSGGDARKLLNVLEIIIQSESESVLKQVQDDSESSAIEHHFVSEDFEGKQKPIVIEDALVEKIIQQKIALYDKAGEMHYDIISAFIKAIRGSDPNAALYYLARMLAGGEDPKFIARRMLILASEDIGNANPTACIMANNCFQSVNVIGYPECDLILAQTVIYLASSAKSNAVYNAIRKAQKLVAESGELSVPLHLRNAPTKLMNDLGYGNDYKYAHQFEGNFINLEYLPDKISGTKFYEPGNNARENEMRNQLKNWWKEKYGY